MNITYAQALALGGTIAEEARRSMAERKMPAEVSDAIEYAGRRLRGRGDPNKTEQRFQDEVTPFVCKLHREPLKFRLAGRTFYTPDFVAYPAFESQTCIEIKGFMRDDAAVKIKTAASLYPEYRWLLVRTCKGGWDVREVTDRGIGRERIAVPWIPGSA